MPEDFTVSRQGTLTLVYPCSGVLPPWVYRVTVYNVAETKAVFELAATAAAVARFLCRHALQYRTSLATSLTTVVAVAGNSDKPLQGKKNWRLPHTLKCFFIFCWCFYSCIFNCVMEEGWTHGRPVDSLLNRPLNFYRAWTIHKLPLIAYKLLPILYKLAPIAYKIGTCTSSYRRAGNLWAS